MDETQEIMIVQRINGKYRVSLMNNLEFFERIAEIDMHKNYIDFTKYGFLNFDDFNNSYVYAYVTQLLNDEPLEFQPLDNIIIAIDYLEFIRTFPYDRGLPSIILPDIGDIVYD